MQRRRKLSFKSEGINSSGHPQPSGIMAYVAHDCTLLFPPLRGIYVHCSRYITSLQGSQLCHIVNYPSHLYKLGDGAFFVMSATRSIAICHRIFLYIFMTLRQDLHASFCDSEDGVRALESQQTALLTARCPRTVHSFDHPLLLLSNCPANGHQPSWCQDSASIPLHE